MLCWEDCVLLLNKYGMPIVNHLVNPSLMEAEAFLKKFHRVVVKLVSPSIAHKTERKLIFTGVDSIMDLRERLKYLDKKMRKLGGSVVVQEFVDGECFIIGGKKDDVFGSVVMVGFGGIYTEVYNDSSFRLAPVNDREATDMVKELEAYKILKGFRGKRYNIKLLKDVIVRASRMIIGEDLKELDINPFVLNERNGFAVDIKIVK